MRDRVFGGRTFWLLLMLASLLVPSAWAGVGSMLTSSQNPAVQGTSITFTASFTGLPAGENGIVYLADGGADILNSVVPLTEAGGVITFAFTTSTLAVGTHPLQARLDSSGSGVITTNTVSQVITAGGGGGGPVPPTFSFTLLPASAAGSAAAGSTAAYNLAIQNTGLAADTYDVTLGGPLTGTFTPASLTVPPGTGANFVATLNVPAGATPGASFVSTVSARSQANGAVAISTLTTTVPGGPGPTPSPGTPILQEVRVDLHPGWNPLGLRTGNLVGLNVPPGVLGFAHLVNGGYQIESPAQAVLTALGVPARAVWVFTQQPGQLVYVGSVVTSAVVPLNQGWNMVSFPNTSNTAGSVLRARQNGAVGPLNAVVLTTFTEINQADNSLRAIDVSQPGAELVPGRTYWVFANAPCEIVY